MPFAFQTGGGQHSTSLAFTSRVSEARRGDGGTRVQHLLECSTQHMKPAQQSVSAAARQNDRKWPSAVTSFSVLCTSVSQAQSFGTVGLVEL